MDVPQRDDWPQTLWTALQRASAPGAGRERAWSELVERYREPVERSVRQRLRGHPRADDAVGDFFGFLLMKSVLPKADRDEGRFRCFLQGVVRRYALQWTRENPVDGAGAAGSDDADEDSPLAELGAHEDLETVELAEESAWANGLLDAAMRRVRAENARDADLLARACGLDDRPVLARGDLARELGLQPNALDQALFRARKRLREALNELIAESVSSTEDFDAERELVLERLLLARPGLQWT